jgi:hypothetical protein
MLQLIGPQAGRTTASYAFTVFQVADSIRDRYRRQGSISASAGLGQQTFAACRIPLGFQQRRWRTGTHRLNPQ